MPNSFLVPDIHWSTFSKIY